MNPTYLQQNELAQRWRLSPRTLERWRCQQTGPNYLKLGARVVYPIDDVEAFERRRRAETHNPVLGNWRG